MRRRRIVMRVEVDVSGDVTTADVRKQVQACFPVKDVRFKAWKATLPDPKTLRPGIMHWPTARVLQRRDTIKSKGTT